ncbi:tRNA (N(6)-L-threonylcarbamoyladenosine(37)-C(2))-methylthiotransferase [Candidatus Woesearchaeota archaeon]|nr:tRNA (N(6)-L-threonylcarbamoyladenosine(37)-C(2))-methylthiotransferase [Candidatus Woesearchaeota archaeon]
MANIHFITFGCTLNQADSELMAGLLQKAGHNIVSSIEDADLVVINSCTVKEQAENKLFRTVREVEGHREVRNNQSSPKSVIITGCVAQADPGYRSSKLKGYSILGTKQLNKITQVVEETIKGNTVHLLDSGNNQRFNRPIIRRNNIIGIIPIAEGCLGSCTYCKARFARGTLHSYRPEDIVNQIKFHLDSGCKEIWLTAQDCGAYGKDIGLSIVSLLREALNNKREYKIRLGMTNPQYVLEHLEELIHTFKSNPDNLFSFLHIPVQAGSNRILKLMNRKYTKEDFIKVCTTLRKEIPDITIATDIICGFPGETEEEFQETLELIKQVQPDVLNRSRFWPRPGTEAAKMPGQLHGRDTNERSRRLEKEFRRIAKKRNLIWKGRECAIILEEKGKADREERTPTWIGRNESYRPVGIKDPGKEFSLGDKVRVRITETHDTYLEAKKC